MFIIVINKTLVDYIEKEIGYILQFAAGIPRDPILILTSR